MKKIKIITIISVILMIIFCFFCTTYAMNFSELGGTPVNDGEAEDLGNKIITTVSVIGSITSVIVLVIIGIKYMLGSTEDKAQYKQTLLPYLIGCIIVFGASSLAGIIYSISTNF